MFRVRWISLAIPSREARALRLLHRILARAIVTLRFLEKRAELHRRLLELLSRKYRRLVRIVRRGGIKRRRAVLVDRVDPVRAIRRPVGYRHVSVACAAGAELILHQIKLAIYV